ncbi:MAG: hypothetical protein M4579_002150 [Chaenotheca gracillima]|nr:MAG: hypothetical protein M4579_002150 [Chaenotheca gracillima]
MVPTAFWAQLAPIALLPSVISAACTLPKTSISATSTTPPGPSGTSFPTQAPQSWVHPGVFVSGPQLDFVASQVRASGEPYTEAFNAMLADPLASPCRTAKPFATVECGPTSTPNIGCYDEREDSMAAYMNAIAWWVTKSKHYADKAISYMDAWSSTIKAHTNSNAPLQAAWSAANWVRVAEIIKSADVGWSTKGIQDFETMLRDVYLPLMIGGNAKENGNWELVMMEASLGAAVFLEDRALYERALSTFAARVPAYIYLTSDGPLPVPGRDIENTRDAIVKYWNNQTTFPVDGITQETCRDFAHTSYGISSISHVAETVRIQGTDLWASTSLGMRIHAALELHSPFQTGSKIPDWLCNGNITRSFDPVVEPPFNALSFRLGMSLPNTEKLVLQQRPAPIGEAEPLFIGWETVTNAQNPY